MQVQAIKTRVFHEGDDLHDFLLSNIPSVTEKMVVVITSKIVALAEGRTAPYLDHNDPEFAKLIQRESEWAMKTKYTWLTIKDKALMSSAGIDRSNVESGKMVLLPKDSFVAARSIRQKLKRHYNVRNLGVLITDSRLLPLRAGIVGIALGYAGFYGIRDYRKTRDIFGRKLRLSRTDVADSLATAAVLLMGEGAEQQPLSIVTDAPVVFTERTVSRKELWIDPHEDVYGPFFTKKRR